MAYTAIDPAWYADSPPAHEILVAEYDGAGVFSALELQLSVRPVAVPSPNFPPTQIQLPVGSDQDASLHATPCGFVRIVSRDSSQGQVVKEREVLADLSSGRFSIGAHNRVQVYATVWGNAGGSPVPVEVQAVVMPSDGSGDWLRNTVQIVNLAAGGTVQVPIPMGARYVELVDPNGVPGAASSINMSMTARVVAQRNYQGNVLVPSTSPVPISALGAAVTDRFITVTNNDGSNPNSAAVVFWVS